jgi:hypothetical protein
MSGYQAPFVQKQSGWIPAQSAAVDADQAIARAPYAGVVSGVSLLPEAAVTGATGTKRTFTLVNKGQSGAGTTVVATLDLITGTNLVAFDESAFTVAAAPANAVAEGDVLAVVETHASTGTAHSGGEVIIEFTRS